METKLDLGNNMFPSITESVNIQHNMKCSMCVKSIDKKIHYTYISPISRTELEICKDCAMREYYGTKRTNTKRYKRDLAKGKLFSRKPVIKSHKNKGDVIKRNKEEMNEKSDVWWDSW